MPGTHPRTTSFDPASFDPASLTPVSFELVSFVASSGGCDASEADTSDFAPPPSAGAPLPVNPEKLGQPVSSAAVQTVQSPRLTGLPFTAE